MKSLGVSVRYFLLLLLVLLQLITSVRFHLGHRWHWQENNKNNIADWKLCGFKMGGGNEEVVSLMQRDVGPAYLRELS